MAVLLLCGQSLIPFHFITSDPLVQETVTDSSRNCRFFTRCTGQNFSNQLILFFCYPYFVLIFMSKCFWTTSIFCTNPNPNCIMKSFFIYSLWCFWPFSLAVQFHTLFLVFITIFHKNTPNTGCPVLGVHIRKTNKSALHFINEVAGKSRLYIIFLLLVQMVLGISSVFYAMLLRGLIDGAVAHDSKKMLTFCVLFVALVVGQIALRAVLRRIR